MREMKDSGIEWIGEIPAQWKVIPHKYVMHKEKTICEHYDGEEIISLTMNGVIVRDLSAGGKMPTTFDGYQYVEPEDLLLCLFDIDVTPRCVGVVRNHGLTSPAYSRVNVHQGYYNAYYDYLLRFIDDEKIFVHLAKNLRSSLTETDFGAIKTIVPPFEEQKHIAKFLDEKCSEIDAVITKTRATVEEYKKLKQSLIMEATSIGIRGKRILKHSGLEWITEIPDEWKVTRAKHILRKLERPMLPTDEVVICSNSGKAFYRGDKSTGLVSLTDNGYQGVEPGDLMIHGMDTWHGAIAISNFRGKCTSVVHVCDSTENKQYIAYYLQGLAFRNVYKAITNGVRQNTSDYRSWDKAGSIQIVLPPYDEQCEIADYLDKKCAEIDTLVEKKTALLEEMESYKKSVIYEYVTGKKEVV